MENMERIKALNILFAAAFISLVVTEILSYVPYVKQAVGIIGPVLTYIIGRILCFKEYKDEAP